MVDNQRFKEMVDYLKKNRYVRNQQDFTERVGSDKATISQVMNNRIAVPKVLYFSIAKAFPFISVEWLKNGEGEMMAAQPATTANDALWLPVVNLDTRGGLTANAETDVEQFYTRQMPFSRSVARDGDFVMPVIGDSMTPKYPNGTFVLVRPIPTWQEYIELGATYILELLDGRRLIKDVRAGGDKDHFLLCSVNPAFDPSEIAKSFISRIYAVILSVRQDLSW